jgi:ribosomal protein S18 acetylase RimI-like enzyme
MASPNEIETKLVDGRPVCIRTIRPSDEDRIRQGIKEMSLQSRYFRFFSAFREPPESVVKQLSAVDGHDHIGWGAILLDGVDYPAIGAAHAVRDEADEEKAELAVALLDDYQGCGLARILIAAVLADCASEGIDVVQMHVMGENHAASDLFEELGAVRQPVLDSVEHYQLKVAATLAYMQRSHQPAGVGDILRALAV